ncbi:helix-turn-helix domain-containing protein [Blautia hansenii]|uniref:helix-turn-helix domain-containing protein n=1 Tax=Blautia hansenii TaxID=1322 RepID=UPI0022E49D34|nr:helix-turn-helix transcriptional regulator [Blautia hansenii]
MISYEPLWTTLKNREVTQYQLINKYHVSAGQLSRLRKNNYISTHTIDILCEILDCKVEDILMYIPNDETKIESTLE